MAEKKREVPNTARYAELKKMLEERQREILEEVRGKIRDIRHKDQEKDHKVLDVDEVDVSDIQEDIEFALIQMKAETLHKIQTALCRLEDGTYCYCFECGEEIPEPRLRALPFAIRCKDCQEVNDKRNSLGAIA